MAVDLAEVAVAVTKPVKIYGALTAATCALLGTVAPEVVQAQEDSSWTFDTGLLYYGEDNDRVQDLSLSVLARRDFLDDRFLTLGMTADALTGASPNGALPQSLTADAQGIQHIGLGRDGRSQSTQPGYQRGGGSVAPMPGGIVVRGLNAIQAGKLP